MSELVSVIIPTFNRAHTLGNALRSVFLQTHQAIEVIVVDDASTDATPEFLKRFSDHRFRLISHASNQGAAAAKNTGVAAAQGKFIAFLDSDDLWVPEKLAHQLTVLQANPTLPACFTACWLQREDGHRFYRTYPTYSSALHAAAFGEMYNLGSTLLIHKAAFLQAGCFREDLKRFEDWEWMFRYGTQFSQFFTCSEPLSCVINSGWPSSSVAQPALLELEKSVTPLLASHCPALLSTFKSSLLYEESVMAYRRKEWGALFSRLNTMLWTQPSYSLHLFQRLRRKWSQKEWS